MIHSLMALTLAAGLNAPAWAGDLDRYRDESRVAVKSFAEQLGEALQKEMKTGGPAAAIAVCKDVAPSIASDRSRRSGWRITRVSARVRNPLPGTPDIWEQQVLANFEQRLAQGEKVEALEFAEVVSEPQGKYYRYMKAVPVGEACLACHGPADKVADGVKARFAQDYPHDEALGYRLGQIRGAFSIKRPL